jgi:hypothetical protein
MPITPTLSVQSKPDGTNRPAVGLMYLSFLKGGQVNWLKQIIERMYLRGVSGEHLHVGFVRLA